MIRTHLVAHRGAGQEGQVIVLYGITLLLLALITMFTISVGVRVREKIKVQAAADAAAYGLAVEQARTMNAMAWANRAVVAEYVSALSVVGHESYLNWWEGNLKAQSKAMYGPMGIYGAQCPGCLGGCSCCCQACISAYKAYKIYKMWDDKWKDVHKRWHTNGQALHTTLHALDVGYIAAAAVLVGEGKASMAQYASAAATFPGKTGKSIDKRIASIGYGAATIKNFTNAVESDPQAEDWDTYHEILSGTRTDWIVHHNKFIYGVPWITGAAKAMQIAEGCEGTDVTIPPSPEGGSMMSKYTGKSEVVQVNTGTDHHYNGGSAKGEGGRVALTSITYGKASNVMVCEACEPVAYGQASQSKEDNVRIEDPHGCSYSTSIANAYDGYSDGDSSAGAHVTWTSANGVPQISCAHPGITAGGFFRFKLDNDKAGSTSKNQKDLWNQPYAFAELNLDTTKDKNNAPVTRPWDFNFGKVGGSLLTLDASKDPMGGTNQGGSESLSGKGFDNLVYPKVGGLGTALTYYHNPKHWAEVPNLWNPYWRAKLEDPTDSNKKKDAARYLTVDLASSSSDDVTVGKAMGY